MQDIVSIITPSFNRADIIAETADSIFNQSYSFWEWIIVDDGSSDKSWEVLQGFAAKDKRVKIYRRDRDPKGACTCRNIAVQKSTGRYLIFLDTDDLLASFCLEQRVAAMEQDKGYDFLIFPMLLFKEKPDDLKLLWNRDTKEDEVNRLLMGDAICQGTGTLWEKRSFEQLGMWNEKLLLWQDVELHLRAFFNGLKFKKRFDLEPDVFLRISETSLSRTGFGSLPKLKSRITVYESMLHLAGDRKLREKYRQGLRYMASDILLSSIHYGYFAESRKLIDLCKTEGIFSNGETAKFSRYMMLRNSGLYRIKAFEDYFFKRVKGLVPLHEGEIGRIPYVKAIHL